MASAIYDAAIAAAQAEVTSLKDEALARLAMWSERNIDPAAVTVSEVNNDDKLVVVNDGKVFLAIREDGEVERVEGKPGEWTRLSQKPLPNLAALGAELT